MTRPSAIVGWDIGGVNTKAARLVRAKGGPTIRWVSHPYEVRHRPEALSEALTEVAGELDVSSADLHAVTMTAELSQAFRTKREGVATVLDALETSFPGAGLHICTVEGRFVGPFEARALPLAVAAANWAATAHLIARSVPTCILIDIGTTSTDLIPIVNGKVVAQGSTDPARLLSGELVYTGALRTPVEAVASRVPLWGGSAGVSADGFALIGDAHLWLGRLRSEDYTCRTPDSRPPTREFAGERLARTVCADREMLDESDIQLVATALVEAQVRSVAESIQRIRQRWPDIRSAVVAGIGDFIAAEAACATGLGVVPLSKLLGAAARIAPAAAVAWLLWHHVESSG
jgi:(4-(4-[2-(gamma-L-glutamylamino)ethyl]phenoxymethyl)furan-2-yl)methanamine synthase